MADWTPEQLNVVHRAAVALAAYMEAMRVDSTVDRASIMAAIKNADAMAKPVYAELYAILNAPAGVPAAGGWRVDLEATAQNQRDLEAIAEPADGVNPSGGQSNG